MNAQEQHVCGDGGGEVAVGVFGRGEDFVLIRVDQTYDDRQAEVDSAVAKGLAYCGMLGWCWQTRKMSFEMERRTDVYTPMGLAVFAFAEMVGRMPPPQPAAIGDSVDWLCSLHSLPDAREPGISLL